MGLGFGLIEKQQTASKQARLSSGVNTQGQIKIDLGIESYKVQDITTNYKSKVFRAPSLKKIQQTLKATGATIIKISTEGRFTVVDYTT